MTSFGCGMEKEKGVFLMFSMVFSLMCFFTLGCVNLFINALGMVCWSIMICQNPSTPLNMAWCRDPKISSLLPSISILPLSICVQLGSMMRNIFTVIALTKEYEK